MYRALLRHLRRSSTTSGTGGAAQILSLQGLPQNHNYAIPVRSYAFSSADEAAAERRRRKRRLRIEPPIGALRRDPTPRSTLGPPLPDSTSALTGPRLNLHNRVQSLIRAGDLDSASAVARQAVFSKVRPTVFTCNAIIAAMYRAGRYTDAISLFQYFFSQSSIIPNIVSYNNLILSHFGNGDIDAAIKTYKHILETAPFGPSCYTYRNLTKGLIEADRIDEAVDMLREMLNKGQGADSLVYNNVISGFLELGNFERANEFFEELQEKCTVYDGVVSATFMDWYFKQGKKKEALEAYKYLMDKQFRMVPATTNVLLEVLLKHGMEKEAWSLFTDMLDNHTPPTFQAVNSDSFNIMVNECFRLGNASKAMEAFKWVGKASKSRPFAMDVAGFNNMIARLCEVDMFEEAESYLEQLQGKSLSPEVTTYRTFIDAYVRAEKADEALEKYRMMVVAGLRVIPAYANKWFSFLIEKGNVEECVPILMKMCEKEPKPDVMSFEVVIRGLCETGRLDGCDYVVAQMMAFGIGITPGFKGYLFQVFEKHGKLGNIQSVIDAKFLPPQIQPPAWFVPLKTPPTEHLSIFPSAPIKRDEPPAGKKMPWQTSVSPQFPREGTVGATQTSGQASSQMRGQMSTGGSQLPPQVSFNAQGASPLQSSVSPQWPGQGSAGASQIPWPASSDNHHVPGASSQVHWQDSVSSQFSTQPLRGASQMPGQGSPQWPGQGSAGASQIPWPASSDNHVPGASSQVHWQNSVSTQALRGASQMPGQGSPQWPGQGSAAASQIPSASSDNHVPGASSQVHWQNSVSSQVSTQALRGASQMPGQGSPQWPGQGSAAASQIPSASSDNHVPGASSQVHWQDSASSQFSTDALPGASQMRR